MNNIPLGILANRIVHTVAPNSGDETIIEFLAPGVAQQQQALAAINEAVKAGRPLPMASLEVFRFAAQKNHGLIANMMKRAMEAHQQNAAPVTPPTAPQPQTGPHPGDGSESCVAVPRSFETGEA